MKQRFAFNRRKLLLLHASKGGGGGGTITTVTGVSPLLLANAMAKPIKSLTQYGKCTQASTPTPSAPVDIMCNNGALRMVDDELPSGYTRLQYVESDGTDGYVDTGIVIDSIDTDVELDYQFASTTSTSPKMAWGYMVTSGSIPRWGFGIYSSRWLGSANATSGAGTFDTDRHTAIMRVYTDGDNSRYSGTLDGDSLYAASALGNAQSFVTNTLPVFLFARNNSSTASNFAPVKIFGFKVYKAGTLTHDLVPCKNDLGVLGFYDLKTNTFLAGTGTLTAGAADYSHAHIGAVGNPEVLTVNGPNLLSRDGETTGYIITADGTVSENANYCISAPFTLGAGDYVCTWNPGTGGNRPFSVYACEADGTPKTDGRIFYKASAVTGINTGEFTVSQATLVVSSYRVNATDLTISAEQTASVVNLFAVGDSADTQELISGAVNRKVGVLVLDGTETWSALSGVFYIRVSAAVTGYGRQAVLSTHYVGTDEANANMPDASMKTANNSGSTYLQLYCKDTSCANVTEFKAKLAEQYAAGTPVIVIYPLAEETTEQVAGQALHTSAGDNVVSVSSNVDPVELAAEYVEVAA